jgi:AAA+ superfamily predicted ATPase
MSQNPNQDPWGAPKPDIIVKHSESTVEVYNLHEMQKLIEGGGPSVRIYDRSDFGGAIERVTLDLAPNITEEGEKAPALTFAIQFDRVHDQSAQIDASLDSTDTTTAIPNGIFSAIPTVFPNVLGVTTTKGMKMLAWFDRERKMVTITNKAELTNRNGGSVKTDPAPISSFGLAEQLEALAPFMVEVVDLCSTEPFQQKNRLGRSYKIGESIKTTPQISGALGKTATTGKVGNPKAELPEIGNFISETMVTFEGIGGYEDEKAILANVVLSFKNAEMMAKYGVKKPQALLLYGEPGNGKTMLVEALANEIGAKLWKIQGTDINDMWHGNSEKAMKAIFEKAKTVTEPTIMFLDEFDSIIKTAEEGPAGSGRASNAVAGVWKQEMNTLAETNPNILVVAATNRVDRIDPALIRSERFDHKIYIPMPNEAARTSILGIKIANKIMLEKSDFKIFDTDINMTELAMMTDGFSGADIESFINGMVFKLAMREARGEADVKPISQEDLRAGLANFRRSKTD